MASDRGKCRVGLRETWYRGKEKERGEKVTVQKGGWCVSRLHRCVMLLRDGEVEEEEEEEEGRRQLLINEYHWRLLLIRLHPRVSIVAPEGSSS